MSIHIRYKRMQQFLEGALGQYIHSQRGPREDITEASMEETEAPWGGGLQTFQLRWDGAEDSLRI